MNIKAFLAALPGIISTIEGGLTLTGTKSERVSKYLAFAEKLSLLIAGSFALATAKGEVLPGVARVGSPLPLQSDEPADAQADVLETLRTLRHNGDVVRFVNSPDESEEREPLQAFALPDFAGLRFLTLAEFGIRALLRLSEELNKRKPRADIGKTKSK
jgi:hypothetical protein